MNTNEYGYTQILQLYKGILGDDIVTVDCLTQSIVKYHHSLTVQFNISMVKASEQE